MSLGGTNIVVMLFKVCFTALKVGTLRVDTKIGRAVDLEALQSLRDEEVENVNAKADGQVCLYIKPYYR